MPEFAMRYRSGEINSERARVLAFALREIASDRSPIAYFEIERRVRHAMRVRGDEPLDDLAAALFLLARAGLVESNGFDPAEPSFTFGADTFAQAATCLSGFIGSSFDAEEEAPD